MEELTIKTLYDKLGEMLESGVHPNTTIWLGADTGEGWERARLEEIFLTTSTVAPVDYDDMGDEEMTVEKSDLKKFGVKNFKDLTLEVYNNTLDADTPPAVEKKLFYKDEYRFVSQILIIGAYGAKEEITQMEEYFKQQKEKEEKERKQKIAERKMKEDPEYKKIIELEENVKKKYGLK